MKTSIVNGEVNKKVMLNSEFWLPLPKSLAIIFIIYFSFLNPASSKIGNIKIEGLPVAEDLPFATNFSKKSLPAIKRKISNKKIKPSYDVNTEQNSAETIILNFRKESRENTGTQTYSNPLMASMVTTN